MSKTMTLNAGDVVHPTPELVAMRPELADGSGTVESLEGDEIIVSFDGRRRYRVSANLVRRGNR